MVDNKKKYKFDLGVKGLRQNSLCEVSFITRSLLTERDHDNEWEKTFSCQTR